MLEALRRHHSGHGSKSHTGLNFSGPIFTTAQVVFITAKIAFIFTSLSARYDFYIFTVVYNCHNNQFVYHLYDDDYFFRLYHFVECPKITFNNSWYIISVSGWSWSWNRVICQSQGGDLISIETEEEWNFIDNEIQRRNNTNYDNRWSIGLEKMAGNWTWVSGRPLTICKWGKGEPSGEHNATFMNKLNRNGEQGVFGSINRLRQGYAYICEIANGKFLVFFLFFRLFVCLFFLN